MKFFLKKLAELYFKFHLRKQKDKYLDLYDCYGDSFESLGWRSLKTQRVRFNVFLKHLHLNQSSILDLGCGLGDFYSYLLHQNLSFNYLGIDIVDSFIIQSQKKYGEHLFSKDYFLINHQHYPNFDYIIASGIFAHTNWYWFEKTIKLAVAKSRKAFCFNIHLTDDKNFFSPDIKSLKRKILNQYTYQIIEGYLVDDYTVIIKGSAV